MRKISTDPKEWPLPTDEVFGHIDHLHCLSRMVWYYQWLHSSIRHLAGDGEYVKRSKKFAPIATDQVRELRRYVNTDLHNYSIEFYLQRKAWAQKAIQPMDAWAWVRDKANMKNGFREPENYSFDSFLAETHDVFGAIHAHLLSINRSLGDLYYFATELPFSAFTTVGKNEILHLTTELNRIMTGLLVATHLQPQKDWQIDLVSYLMSCRTDCQRLLQTTSHYYQSHRLRLVPSAKNARRQSTGFAMAEQMFPNICLPWCAGVYMDFINAYRIIGEHVLAILNWSIRLFARLYFVPERILDAIAPAVPSF